MKRTILPILLLTAFLSGCTVYQIDSKDSTLDFYPPKQTIEEVKYLETVDAPFVEIGVVTVVAERRQTFDDILPKLLQEAAILGGDAITDVQTNAGGVWKNVKIQKLLGNAYVRSHYTAKVIVLK